MRFIALVILALAQAAAGETWAWDPVSGASGYEIEASDGSTGASAEASISFATANPDRSIRVRATDGVVFGPWSEWSFRAGFDPDCDGDGFIFPSDYTCFLEAAKVGTWPH